jgi:hypothetical protein
MSLAESGRKRKHSGCQRVSENGILFFTNPTEAQQFRTRQTKRIQRQTRNDRWIGCKKSGIHLGWV